MEKEERIKSINEAFSMQPLGFFVTLPEKRSKWHPDDDIERIDIEITDDDIKVYVGYNFDGVKKFQFIANACNVIYF